MIEFIDPNSNKVVSIGPEMSRKAYYIHGTTSDRTRWDMYPSTVQQLNRIAFGIGVEKNDTEGRNDMGKESFKKACCDFSFQWGNNGVLSKGNNWFFNTVEDRRIASEKLIEHISGNIGKCEEVVLIGHSHGGNVAIQAADKMFTKIPTIKRVFVLTIGTPAYNSPFIISTVNNKYLTTIQEGVCENALYLGKEYIVPVMKFGRKMLGALGTVYLYINCENPIMWKHKDQIRHTALWNKRDWVDNAAWALDRLPFYHSMTLNKSGCFTNPTTDNVEFDFDSKETGSNLERQIKPFAEWLSKLDYLRSCLIELRFKQYAIPEMPQLFTYKEYTAARRKKMSLSESMDQVYVNQRDALRVNTIEPKSTVKWKYLSAKLREETNNLEELFKSINAFYQFMTEIDCAKKVIKPCSIQDVIDIYQQKYPEIEAIEKIKQEMYRETEFLEIAKAIYLLDNTSFQEHSFDLANPKMIEEAIDNGRIKPFPRVQATNRAEE